MVNNLIIFVLSIISILGVSTTLFYVFENKKMKRQLNQLTRELEAILDNKTEEKVMIFTGNNQLIKLLTQINRMIETLQKEQADFRRNEMSTKRMISNISHDIKTPLTVILGYLEIIRIKETIDREMLRKVEDKANQVLDMIDKFFTLAKLESRDMEVSLTEIDISEVCKESLLDFYDILVEKDFKVETNITDGIYGIGNADILHRILFNLISNVLRYGNDGKYIKISVFQEVHHIIIEVTDRGKGIDQDSINLVFERLYTLDDSRNKGFHGNGLGLTIAKKLVEAMDGEINLVSSPFIETTFSVKLKK